MRYPLFLLLFTALVSSALGQDVLDIPVNDTTQLPQKLKIRGFVQLGGEFSSIDNVSISSSLFSAAAIVNDKFILGFFRSDHSGGKYVQKVVFPNDFELKYTHGGIWLGYMFKGQGLFDLIVENRLSFGEVRWVRTLNGEDFLDSKMSIIHPSVGVDFNPEGLFKRKRIKPSPLSNIYRFNASLGYRSVSGLAVAGLENSDISGLVIALTLKIGYFK